MNITLEGISKIYLYKRALNGVSVTFQNAKINALLGENGAGKSTLASIISGNAQPTDGTMKIDGIPFVARTPKEAIDKGIILVHQHPLLSQELNTIDNILLSQDKGSFFLKPPSARLDELIKEWDPMLDKHTKVKDLGANHRFYISLIRALLKNPKLLILDEPGASLDKDERKNLYENLKKLTQKGTTIIVITHSSAEAIHFADTVTLLKEGALESFFASAALYEQYMLQNKQSHTFSLGKRREDCAQKGRPCFSIQHASCRPHNKSALLDATFTVNYGEITAINGTREAALDTLEELVCGMPIGGSKGRCVFIDEQGREHKRDIARGELNTSFLRRMGSAIVPTDKVMRASNPDLTIEQMLTVYYPERNTNDMADFLIKQAGIKISPKEKVLHLSGGMLQRLILARELQTNPSLIILCNPMQALDIEAQTFICKKLFDLSKDGKAVLLIGAADFPLTLCSRVYNLEGGSIQLSYGEP